MLDHEIYICSRFLIHNISQSESISYFKSSLRCLHYQNIYLLHVVVFPSSFYLILVIFSFQLLETYSLVSSSGKAQYDVSIDTFKSSSSLFFLILRKFSVLFLGFGFIPKGLLISVCQIIFAHLCICHFLLKL